MLYATHGQLLARHRTWQVAGRQESYLPKQPHSRALQPGLQLVIVFGHCFQALRHPATGEARADNMVAVTLGSTCKSQAFKLSQQCRCLYAQLWPGCSSWRSLQQGANSGRGRPEGTLTLPHAMQKEGNSAAHASC